MRRLTSIFLISLFFVSPLLLMLLGIFYFLTKNPNWKLSLSLFFALLSFLLKPTETYDIFRHYQNFELLTDDFDDFYAYYFLTAQSDFILPLLIFFFKKFSLNYKFFFSILTFINFYLIFLLFDFYIKDSLGISRRSVHFLILVLSISYISIFSGVRFYLALAFFLLAFFLFQKKKKIFVSILILSIITHFSFVLFGLMFIIVFILKQRFLMKVILLGILLLLISLVVILISEWSLFAYIQKGYIENEISNNRLFIWYILSYSFILPAFYFAIFKNKIIDNNSQIILNLLLVLMLVTIGNFVLFDRVIMLFLLLFQFILINEKVSFNFLLIYALFLMPRFFGEIYDNYEVYTLSYSFQNLIFPFY